MEPAIRYRGRVVTGEDIAFIRELIRAHPEDSRWALSKKLCQAWNWVQPNGALRDMVCRGLMLKLHRGGHIQLPATRLSNLPAPSSNRKKISLIEVDQTPIHGAISELAPLEFRQVRRTPSEALFNSLVEHHHYLGYCQPVGEHLKYIIYSKDRPIACLAWSSAPRHIGCRDRFIGWPKEMREKHLSLIACNTRYLLLPWIRIPHLASHVLGAMARILPRDWERVYNHPLHYLETFVDTELFAGTCYRAANWIYIGQTTGRGIKDKIHKQTRSIKAVWGYPLTKDFRRHLGGMPA